MIHNQTVSCLHRSCQPEVHRFPASLSINKIYSPFEMCNRVLYLDIIIPAVSTAAAVPIDWYPHSVGLIYARIHCHIRHYAIMLCHRHRPSLRTGALRCEKTLPLFNTVTHHYYLALCHAPRFVTTAIYILIYSLPYQCINDKVLETENAI